VQKQGFTLHSDAAIYVIIIVSSPKMKISPSFAHPQAILGVYDFLLSAKHCQGYIKKYPGTSRLGSEWMVPFFKA